jgi:uncharacterized protein (AIM24 family)
MASLVLTGDTSGQVTIAAPAVAGTNTITLPASTGTAIISDASANIQFNSGYGSVATAYGCRAWVNFNGTGTVAIRGSGNVSSITDSGTGNYRVNFTTAISDANYSANVTVSLDGVPAVSGTVRQCMVNSSGTMTTTYCDVSSFATTGTSVSDAAVMNVAIFR